MGEFRMPSLGADMEAGKIVEWLVHEGDAVRRGDIVAVIDTDKADIDVEVFEDGVVERILVPAGERVAVGTPLAEIRGAGEPSAPQVPVGPAAVAPAAPPSPSPSPPPSPVVRRLARHLGVDLATVRGTGPGGVIQRADVEAAAAPATGAPAAPVSGPAPAAPTAASAAAPETPADARPERAASMREAIGKLMARSWREIPHYRLEQSVDMSAARARLDELNAQRAAADRLLPAVLFGAAVARAAREHPDLNGFFLDGAHRPADSVHLGFAIALRGGGLIAPAIHHADTLTLDELAAAMRDLVTRARGGRLRASEMSDATITVTSLGERGVDVVHGIIFPPQVAIVGFGAVVERPWARDGMLGVNPVVQATLAADHRVSDGHAGALFLRRVAALLTSPALLEEES